MPIRVSCPCGFVKDVPDEWAGKKAKCKCGQPLVIPAKPETLPESKLEPATSVQEDLIAKSERPNEPSPSPTVESVSFSIETDHPRRKKKSNPKQGTVIAVGIGSAILLVVGIGIWAVSRSPPGANAVNDAGQGTGSSVSAPRSSPLASTQRPRSRNQQATAQDSDKLDGMEGQMLVAIQQPAVAQMLKLTASQQQSIQSIMQKHTEALSDDGAVVDTTDQLNRTMALLAEILTSQQRTQLSEMFSSTDGFRYEDENTKVIVTGPVPEGTPITRWSAGVDGVSLAEINDGPIEIPECLGLVVPKRPSNLIALKTGPHGDYTYSIFDLGSQQTRVSAALNDELITQHEDISGDGTRYAVTKSERDKATGEYRYWVVVGSFGNEAVIEMPLADGASGVQFADNKTLIARQKNAKTLAVIDIASKQVTHQISYPQRQPDEYLVSPGGKYLFVSRAVKNLFVDVYEVQTGERVGSLVAPTDGEHYVFQSMTISPNGQYLALGSYRAYQKGGSQVAVWDLSNGKLTLKLDRRSAWLDNISKQSAIVTNDGSVILAMNTAVDRTGTEIIWRRRLNPQLGPPRAYALAKDQKLILLGKNAEVFPLSQNGGGAAIAPELRPEHGLPLAFSGMNVAKAYPSIKLTPEQAERIMTLSEPLQPMRSQLISGNVTPATWKQKCIEIGGAIIDVLDDEQRVRHWDSLSSGSTMYFDLEAETARLQPKR